MCAAVLLSLGIFVTSAYEYNTCNVAWTGSVDAFFDEARAQLQAAAICEKLTITLLSPGGSVFATVELSQLIKERRAAGTIVEIHGRSLVASGATVLLAAGTPGYRFIKKRTFAVVHGVQRISPFGQVCVAYNPSATSDTDRLDNHHVIVMAQEYADSTHQPLAVTLKWLECAEAHIGNGDMLVNLHIADKVE